MKKRIAPCRAKLATGHAPARRHDEHLKVPKSLVRGHLPFQPLPTRPEHSWVMLEEMRAVKVGRYWRLNGVGQGRTGRGGQVSEDVAPKRSDLRPVRQIIATTALDAKSRGGSH